MPRSGSWIIPKEIRSDMYDIAVVGAGPAGSAFARLAPKHLKIAIIDKRNLDETGSYVREKCCGGLLAPAAQKELAQQGLGVPVELLSGPQTFSVKSIDFDNELIRFYQRHYINIDREGFDRWLVSLTPSNVDKYFESVFTDYIETDNSFRVRFRNKDGISEIEARYLVAADGAASMIRSRAVPEGKEPEKYVSIQDSYLNKGIPPYYYSIFNKETTDFYSWMIQKGNILHYGTAIPWGSDIIRKHDELAEKLISRGILSGEFIKRSGAIIYRPTKNSGILLNDGNIFFIGEASGMISPSSAEGISYALKGGRKLAESFCTSRNPKKAYLKNMRRLRANIAYKNIKSFVMYNRFLRKIVMKSGLMSIGVEEYD